jgi:hypothetical protein
MHYDIVCIAFAYHFSSETIEPESVRVSLQCVSHDQRRSTLHEHNFYTCVYVFREDGSEANELEIVELKLLQDVVLRMELPIAVDLNAPQKWKDIKEPSYLAGSVAIGANVTIEVVMKRVGREELEECTVNLQHPN